MSKRILFAAASAAILAAAAFATPSAAQITGTGACLGLAINSAWVDWGPGTIRANVYNHNGDNSAPATVTFHVTLNAEGKVARSVEETARPRASLDVDVASTLVVFGKTPLQLQQANHPSVTDPYGYFITGGRMSLVDCTRP